MKANYFFIFLVFIFYSCSKKQAVTITKIQPLSSHPLYSVLFINDSLGYVGGGTQFDVDEIYKTTNAGNTWQLKQLLNCSFTKAITCFVPVDSKTIFAYGYSGVIGASSDSGNSFNYLQLPSYENIQNAVLVGDTIIVVTGKGYGGSMEWLDLAGYRMREKKYNIQITDIGMADNKIGYASCSSNVLKTIDGGSTWDYTNAQNDIFSSIIVLNTNECIVCGKAGSIKYSKDGANTWHTIKQVNIMSETYRWNKIIKANATIAYVFGDNGKLGKINLQDNSYTNLASFTDANLLNACVKNNTTIAIVADNGVYYEMKVE